MLIQVQNPPEHMAVGYRNRSPLRCEFILYSVTTFLRRTYQYRWISTIFHFYAFPLLTAVAEGIRFSGYPAVRPVSPEHNILGKAQREFLRSGTNMN